LSDGVDFLAGGGELGERIRALDWERTPLGLPERWPQSLRIAVRIMLASRQPIWIGWGEELTYLYNDPYKAIVGGKHPQALGQPTREVWREIADVIGPMLDTALSGDAGTYVESQLLIMERYGYREETYYTFSYSPIPADDGSAGGIICANTDDTQRVIGERQLALLRELGSRTAEARTGREVCVAAADALATNPRDVPFALFYVAGEDGALELVAGTGVDPGHPVAQATADYAKAVGQRSILTLDAPDASLPSGVWDEAPSRLALVPLAAAGETGKEGVLVVGLNPFRRLDDAYVDFLTLVGGQVSASIAAAQAYEAERMRAEALAEIDRAKTVFFSNVSHEFRTPLTLMLGPLDDVLAQADALPEPAREALEVARRNALRLLRMVNTVLDFSRLGAGTSAPAFRPTDLTRVTTDLAGRFGALFERGGLELDLDVRPLPEPVYVDAEAWETIVLNLLSNAFKFTLAGGVRLALEPLDGHARLVVADTGTGIPAEELPNLFERFHRVRNEQARTQEGTGIGLALVRELVELHGGAIAVESAVGRGTTFTVTLPLGHAHLPAEHVEHEARDRAAGTVAVAFAEEASRWIGLAPDAEPDAPAPAPSATRVAVVDDNADMRDYMAALLARHWRVETYPDGRAALDAILADPPDVVVTDVMMPRLDGFGLLTALRAEPATATIPVIVVSARAGEESSVEGLDLGADDYLVKPFSARELVARVRVNLELARLRADAGRVSALEEVRSRVITTVSHELRTPVTAIYGAARTLDRAGELDEETRGRLLAVIAGESERLARITDDILTTETLAAGLLSFTPEPVDVREAATAAVDAAQLRTGDSRAVRLQAPGEPLAVTADRVRLQQVLANLLDNAIKYSHDGGEVELALARVDGSVRVVVADDGRGIPEDARDHVFDRFYRVDPELTGGVGGSGLGLYICRELVQAMGGTIAVEPNEPRGTRFVVTLPS
jgi:signal transduction histidine kinase